MKSKPDDRVERYRVTKPPASRFGFDRNYGNFRFPLWDTWVNAVADDALAQKRSLFSPVFEHVKARPDYGTGREATWKEMDCVKRVFWADDEFAVQYHPAFDDNAKRGGGWLHLWKAKDCPDFPCPTWALFDERKEELMRDNNHKIETARSMDPDNVTWRGKNCGVFYFRRFSDTFAMIADDGVVSESGWEHITVVKQGSSHPPSWEEMCWVKSLFWRDDECVLQYHPPRADYIDDHPCVLHLWRPTDGVIPVPPKELV